MLILVLSLVGLLALGAMIGGIFGGIVTGDWRYTIVWTVAMAVLVLCLIVVVTSRFMTAARGADAPAPRSRRPLRIVVGIVIVVIGAVVPVLPSADAVGRIGTNQSFLTGPNQQRAVDAIAAIVGSRELVDIDFYQDYVDAQAPSSPGANTTDNFEYRYGDATRLGAEPDGGSDSTKTTEYDGSKVDFALIPKLIKDAERRTKTPSPTSLHVFVMQPLDAKAGQAPTINIEVDTPYRDNQVHYSQTGEFIDGVGDSFKDN